MSKATTEAKPRQRFALRLGLIDEWRARRPDHSREGFDAACDATLAFVEQYDWHSIDELCSEICVMFMEALRMDAGCEFIATHHVTGRPRVVVRAGAHTWRHDIGVNFTARKPGKAN